MNYEIEHAGSSGTWRPIGQVACINMAVAASREVLKDGYDVRIMRAGSVWMNSEQVRTYKIP
jgi:hypothetical protein